MFVKIDMSLLARITCSLTILLLCAAAQGSTALTPHTAEYKVKISVISGQLNTELRRTPDGYVARHIITPTGMSRLISRGTMDVTSEFIAVPEGILPSRYTAIDSIRDDPDVSIDFDWTDNVANGTVGEESVHFELDGIAYDNVAIQYELMHDLLNNSPSKQYSLFDVDKMRIANVENIGEKVFKTKAGEFTAVGIRHRKRGSSRTVTLWCVKELDYLPVVIEQHRKGKLNFRATLVSYTPSSEESSTASPASAPQ